MKRFAMLTLLMFAPVLLVQADDKPGSPDGSYKVTGLAKAGMKAPAEVLKTFDGITIKGDKITMKSMGESKTATIKVDTKANPATIDLTPDDGPEKGKTKLGIWKLEKGVLTIVLTEANDAPRPKDFSGKGADDITLELTLEPKK